MVLIRCVASFGVVLSGTAVRVAQVFERYYSELLGFLARHMGGDRDAAADVAQETFARAWALQSEGRQGEASSAVQFPRALLYRIARNLVIDQHRQARHQSVESLEGLEMHAPENLQPEVIHASRQRTTALLKAIEALPPRCREAFVLHKFDGLSHAEVAQQMGISRNMVEKHVIRAMLVCRSCLDGMDDASCQSCLEQRRADDV